jgi:hypothetical protein
MCLKCTAPHDRYYVRDRATGLIVCEECGFAVKSVTDKGAKEGDFIWIFNSEWPEFHSFDELLNLFLDDEDSLPGFTLSSRYPSRLFTAVLDLMHESGEDSES